ncbi:MAG: DUF1289 domain-containing protein [Gammaproteobacteria bacterium]
MSGFERRVQSPCIRNCCLDADDICLGCLRHLDEIKAWANADDRERREIIRLAEMRGKERALLRQAG